MTKEPTQSLIDFVQDVKPYHTKVVEILIDYVYQETVNVSVQERLDWDIELSFDGCQLPESNYGEDVGRYGIDIFGGVWSELPDSAPAECQRPGCVGGFSAVPWGDPFYKPLNGTLDIGRDQHGNLVSDTGYVGIIEDIIVPVTFVIAGDASTYFSEQSTATTVNTFANRGEWRIGEVIYNIGTNTTHVIIDVPPIDWRVIDIHTKRLKPIVQHTGEMITEDRYSAFVEEITLPSSLIIPGNTLVHFPPTSEVTITNTFANDGIWEIVSSAYNSIKDQTSVVVRFARPIAPDIIFPTNSYGSLLLGLDPTPDDGTLSNFDNTECSYVSPTTALTKFKETHEINISFPTQPAFLNIIDVIGDSTSILTPTELQGLDLSPWGMVWDGFALQNPIIGEPTIVPGKFVLTGNQSRYFKTTSTGSMFIIQQSDGNDGVWTTRRVVYNAHTNTTDVWVMEPITSERYPLGIIVEDIAQFRDVIGVSTAENTISGAWSAQTRELAPTCRIEFVTGVNQLQVHGDVRRFFAINSAISIDKHEAWGWSVLSTTYNRGTNTTTITTLEPLPTTPLYYVSGQPSWIVGGSWGIPGWSNEPDPWLVVSTQTTPGVWTTTHIYDLTTSI